MREDESRRAITAVSVLGKDLDESLKILGLKKRKGAQQVTEDLDEYWTFLSSGAALLLKNGSVSSVFLYADGHDGFTGFQGDTGGLRMNSSKQVVRYKFGNPTQFRDAPADPVLGTVPIYDRYDYDSYSYHFQYDPTGTRMLMMTIMSAEEVRRINPRPGDNGPVVYDKAKYHQESVAEQGLPESQAAVHTAFFLGWLMDNNFCSEEFVEESRDEIEAYKNRDKTAMEIYSKWDWCLVDDMLNAEGNAFAQDYFLFSSGRYIDDYVNILEKNLPSEFHVEYNWENQDRISHKIGSRYRTWRYRQDNPGLAPEVRKRRTEAKARRARERQKPADKKPRRPAAQAQVRQKRPARRRKRIHLSGWKLKFLQLVVLPVVAVSTAILIIWYAENFT